MPASPRRQAWPPTCPRRTIHPSLPCPDPLSFRMCRGLHSYLRPYTSNTSSSSSSSKRSIAGSSHTPGSDPCIHTNTTKKQMNKNPDIFKSNLYLITEEPRSVFPWTLTDCVRATSTPLPSMFLSQWHNNRGTWPKAPTGESPLGINENSAELRNDPVFFIFPPICLSATLPGMGYVNLATFLSICRDLSVDAGLPHHQYQLQQLPQHYQHYLASPRMHHFPRNTSSAQVVCWSLPQVALDSLIVCIPAVI